jgi:phage terminase large subunit
MFVLLHPDAPSRYRAGSGGRGSGKSHAFAAAIVLRMLDKRVRELCAREIQRSLREWISRGVRHLDVTH